MLTIEQFWGIIDSANFGANNDIAIINDNVLNQLVLLDNEDILLWQKIFNEYFDYTEGNQLHVAFYIIDGSYNQLAFDSYRAGLISFGEKLYMSTLHNPDTLAEHEFVDGGVMLNAAFLSVAKIAYIMKNSEQNFDFEFLVEEKSLDSKMKKAIYDSIDFSLRMDYEWEDSEKSLKKLCPKLFERFW